MKVTFYNVVTRIHSSNKDIISLVVKVWEVCKIIEGENNFNHSQSKVKPKSGL